MAKPNDMPELHSVKVSLTENIPVFIPELKYAPAAYAGNGSQSANKGGRDHV
ncbi:hypothetical protein SG34_016855 [Thalassomonas viridans]|uniref:Uncharacterized protein n=1 Tax=Thalassomonas viridans TaxID=137584 RepID=A0AAE9YY60_9GAMM|nr:hypothetical protein [Thalassomonas viridans]WDE03093.1 hypothetical protein SG34_016855 [Thalassomonas viridans]